jgi:hypothetical protein
MRTPLRDCRRPRRRQDDAGAAQTGRKAWAEVTYRMDNEPPEPDDKEEKQ